MNRLRMRLIRSSCFDRLQELQFCEVVMFTFSCSGHHDGNLHVGGQRGEGVAVGGDLDGGDDDSVLQEVLVRVHTDCQAADVELLELTIPQVFIRVESCPPGWEGVRLGAAVTSDTVVSEGEEDPTVPVPVILNHFYLNRIDLTQSFLRRSRLFQVFRFHSFSIDVIQVVDINC